MKRMLLAFTMGILAASRTGLAQDAPRFGTGLIMADEPSPVQIEEPELFGAAPLPSRISWREKLPPAGNQGLMNSCVAWSLGYGLLSYLHGTREAFNPLYIYHWCRLNEMTSTSAAIEDRGASFEAGFQAIVNNGSCRMADYTDFRYPPPAGLRTRARQSTVALKLPATTLSVSDLYTIKKRLSEGKVLPAGFRIYAGFEDLPTEEGMFEWVSHPTTGQHHPVWKKKGRPPAGMDKHAMLITGYDDDLQAFEVLNSYGDYWGEQGYLWVDYEFFRSQDQGRGACCLRVYDYQESVASVFQNQGGEAAVRQATRDGQMDAYVKLATFEGNNPTPTDINFDLPEGRTVETLKVGDDLSLRPEYAKLTVRGALAADPETGNTSLAKPTGQLKKGEQFKVSELRKVTIAKGNKVEYWAKGTIQKN